MGGKTAGFNESRPWDYVWRALSNDSEYWREQFIEPATLILAHVKSLSSTLGGDAPVQAANLGQSQVRTSPIETQTSSRSRALARPVVRRHEIGDDGLHTVNRNGRLLCQGFQTGECKAILPGTSMVCAKDDLRNHQCAKCLQPGHGAHACRNEPARMPKGGKSAGKSGKRSKSSTNN